MRTRRLICFVLHPFPLCVAGKWTLILKKSINHKTTFAKYHPTPPHPTNTLNLSPSHRLPHSPLAACSTWVNSSSKPAISGYLASMISSKKCSKVDWPSTDFVELSCRENIVVKRAFRILLAVMKKDILSTSKVSPHRKKLSDYQPVKTVSENRYEPVWLRVKVLEHSRSLLCWTTHNNMRDKSLLNFGAKFQL